MSLRPAVRIPRRFVRPVSKRTQRLVARRHGRAFGERLNQRWRRWGRGVHRSFLGWRRALLWWLILAAVGLMVLTVAIFIFSPVGKIEEIRVIRTDPRLDIEEVLTSLSPLFGRYLVGVSSREVHALLSERFQDVSVVDVSKRYPSQLVVRITLDPLVARVRIMEPTGGVAGSGTVVGALTERGVFNLATTLPTGTGSLPTIDIVDWGARPESGARLLSSAFLKTMGDAEAILQAQFGQTVGQRTVYLRAQEFHFGIQGISLWFDAQSSLEVQLQRYRTFLQSVGLSSAREYIDLRIADKVIYR